jgi:hypothetical protein
MGTSCATDLVCLVPLLLRLYSIELFFMGPLYSMHYGYGGEQGNKKSTSGVVGANQAGPRALV